MTVKICLVEDDAMLRDSVRELLEGEGYEFSGFNSAEDFLWATSLDKIDLLVVDRNLPGQNGISLVKKIRETNCELPITFLTSALSDEDVVEGLDAGANDYVTKPFTGPVLLARLRALLRLHKKDTSVASVIDWNLDEKTREVVVEGRQFSLSSREFEIFQRLSANRGNVVEREDLLTIDENISGRNVDVHIVSLRKKLDPSGIIIQTIRGVGYRVQ